MMSKKKVRILSRKSDLAIIQAKEAGNNLLNKFPNLEIEYLTKSTAGDKDLKTPLSEMSSPGVFTDDLRNSLINKDCDLIVHSWKDLPLDLGHQTIIAGTMSRADQRDILFIKKKNISKIKNNNRISVLSSSPRRIYNLELFVKEYLPFNIKESNFINIRGNIPTRFRKFIEGEEDSFILAKAALDRLINNNINEFKKLSKIIKKYINQCFWTITPLSINPTSPGQGALAFEIRGEDKDLKNIIKKINNTSDYNCVERERKILKNYGGGCHQKIGVSFFKTNFGLMHSARGEISANESFQYWKNENNRNLINKKIKFQEIFPENLNNYKLFKRKTIDSSVEEINKLINHCIWISRNNALPKKAKINLDNIIWTSGLKTWRELVKRGIWVNGTSDGMGEDFNSNISSLTDYPWIKFTHNSAPKTSIEKRIKTYELIKKPIKFNLNKKKYFYWMSSSAFKYALEENPSIIKGYHSCGPGNTYKELKKVIGEKNNLNIFLSYNEWKNYLLGN